MLNILSRAVELLGNWIAAADAILWGPILLTLLLGTHLLYTVRLRGVQRYLAKSFSLIIRRDSALSGNISPMSALAVALASTIGTGNVIGVATAIAIGGPGAVFWCMVTGLFGMATKYSESLLAVKYREVDEHGEVHGGPMYTIKNGLHCQSLALLFCVTGAIAVMGTGNLVQSNAIASVFQETFGVPLWVTGICLTIMVALVIIGGLQSIAKVCTAMVPLMGAIYICGCALLLFLNRAVLADSLVLIWKCAFNLQAGTGAFAGYTMMLAARYGIARGLFSNEAGMGSEPIVAATAQTRNAVRQGLVSSSGTFCTIIICALTGLAIVSSMLADPSIDCHDPLLTQAAFARLPVIGKYLLSFVIFAFASTTLIGWCYYGEQCVLFIFHRQLAVKIYRLVFILTVFLGAIGSLAIVWNFSDLANGCMVIPNIISVLLLQKVVIGETKKYLWSGKLEDFDDACRHLQQPK